MRPWPGEPFPLGPSLGRERHQFLDHIGERRSRRALPVRRGRRRDPLRASAPDGAQLARVPARRRPGPALRLSRLRALGSRAGAPLQPQQAPDRPLREGDRGAGPLGSWPDARVRRRRRPRAGRERRRRGDPEVGRDRRLVRLGGRPAAPAALGRDRDLRAAREGLHATAAGRARGPPRHLCRAGLRRGDRAPRRPGRDGGRAAAHPPHRRRALPPGTGADELLGLLDDRLPRPARRATPRPAPTASRCASSRGSSRRCIGPGSR